MRTAAIIAVAWIGASVPIGLLVGRFIWVGQRPHPPTPPYRVGDLTTYQRSRR